MLFLQMDSSLLPRLQLLKLVAMLHNHLEAARSICSQIMSLLNPKGNNPQIEQFSSVLMSGEG